MTPTRRIALLTLWLAGALAWPAPAPAWGGKGHRLTALVAWELMSTPARARLQVLMGSTDLASISLYLDEHKDALEQRIKGSRGWHFDNRPACDRTAGKADYCPGGHCASVQLRRHFHVLVDPNRPAVDKRFALRVIAHVVGDIHQPLHAASHDDLGGNLVKLAGRGWMAGRQANLHGAWDNDFVRLTFSAGEFRNLPEREVARRLVRQITAEERAAWLKGRSAAWLEESHAIARKSAYGALPGFACGAETGGALTLGAEYIDAAVATVPKQIQRGGVRLAALLNRALSSRAASAGVWLDRP
jgi:hypothetical protein